MKRTTEELNRALDRTRRFTPVGTRWLHKSGGRYTIFGHAIDTNNGDVCVLYLSEENILFSRPDDEWSIDRFVQLP